MSSPHLKRRISFSFSRGACYLNYTYLQLIYLCGLNNVTRGGYYVDMQVEGRCPCHCLRSHIFAHLIAHSHLNGQFENENHALQLLHLILYYSRVYCAQQRTECGCCNRCNTCFARVQFLGPQSHGVVGVRYPVPRKMETQMLGK